MEKKLTINNLFSLKGKVVLITGASGVLGTVYVSTLLNAGARVIAVDKIKSNSLIDSLKNDYFHSDSELVNLHCFSLDITKENDVKVFFNQTLRNEKWFINGVDVLINNASLVKQVGNSDLSEAYAIFEKQGVKDWDPYLQVDLIGALLMVSSVIPPMKERGSGVIINISSTYGNVAPDQRLYDSLITPENNERLEKPIGYSISKGAVLNMTRHLATLYASDGIRVNTLTPGGVYANNPELFVSEYSKRTPLGRMSDRTEYAGPILFLSSDASSYVTGSNLVVDGGWTAW
jgi:NAD(P)-dependent dehydrogenase (short-subunit alcohol dehydrogenase family)